MLVSSVNRRSKQHQRTLMGFQHRMSNQASSQNGGAKYLVYVVIVNQTRSSHRMTLVGLMLPWTLAQELRSSQLQQTTEGGHNGNIY